MFYLIPLKINGLLKACKHITLRSLHLVHNSDNSGVDIIEKSLIRKHTRMQRYVPSDMFPKPCVPSVPTEPI
jgi:hypothetical protein